MKTVFVLILWAVLAGCNAPHPSRNRVEPTRITVQTSTFDVRQTGTLAEAIRVSPQYAPRLGRIADRALIAIEQVTECRVRRLLGDAAVITARLKC